MKEAGLTEPQRGKTTKISGTILSKHAVAR